MFMSLYNHMEAYFHIISYYAISVLHVAYKCINAKIMARHANYVADIIFRLGTFHCSWKIYVESIYLKQQLHIITQFKIKL